MAGLMRGKVTETGKNYMREEYGWMKRAKLTCFVSIDYVDGSVWRETCYR
jgi:hypothetical protein